LERLARSGLAWIEGTPCCVLERAAQHPKECIDCLTKLWNFDRLQIVTKRDCRFGLRLHARQPAMIRHRRSISIVLQLCWRLIDTQRAHSL
jgi:hypothetical protein